MVQPSLAQRLKAGRSSWQRRETCNAQATNRLRAGTAALLLALLSERRARSSLWRLHFPRCEHDLGRPAMPRLPKWAFSPEEALP